MSPDRRAALEAAVQKGMAAAWFGTPPSVDELSTEAMAAAVQQADAESVMYQRLAAAAVDERLAAGQAKR